MRTPMTNTTKAIPNNMISIKVMTPTVYLPGWDFYTSSGPTRDVSTKEKDRSPEEPGPV